MEIVHGWVQRLDGVIASHRQTANSLLQPPRRVALTSRMEDLLGEAANLESDTKQVWRDADGRVKELEKTCIELAAMHNDVTGKCKDMADFLKLMWPVIVEAIEEEGVEALM
ncbi:hypothetical protein B0A48_04690 [Cryoendolithus antarcticus]|uniref:Uncharacterized protein n=1 Tax=Cryoendolithus antarcticus TaxID=1507870 RepID=A0A1V8TDK6_9PEZI|nr:hypothetical protein B0A48_04690 [Cryoendolithus antarcticus]